MVKKKKKITKEKVSKEVKKQIKKITKKKSKKVKTPRISKKNIPTLKLKNEREIANDFAEKIYQKFDRLIKAVILFGSSIKHTNVGGSDIDIIIIVDDAIIKFDEKLIMWYREELGKLIQTNPYKKNLHINTVKLTTWWEDLVKGDPTVINIIRYGESLIDYAGFFDPLKMLLQDGKIKTTPESMYIVLNRIPLHIIRSKQSELGAIEGVFWSMVETAQALLMAVKVVPPSPEHIAILLKENFVDKKLLKMKYVVWVRDIYDLHRRIMHQELRNIEGKIIDEWQERAQEFFETSLKIIDNIV